MRRDAIILPRRGAKRYNRNMEPKPLTETNPYLRDPETVRRLIREDARQSSVFEGAHGLPRAERQPDVTSRRRIASTKKAVNKS